ncbi:MAG: MFS transporter, partial [Rhodobacterales bacterium CG15_BIG_FIL_POST_REV_8_21_14_020_59_13]
MSARIAVSLIGQRRYWPMLVAQSLGAFNDNFFRYALVTIVTFQSVSLFGLNSELLVPIAASAFTLPIFLFSAIAGRIADKFDRSKMMRFAK